MPGYEDAIPDRDGRAFLDPLSPSQAKDWYLEHRRDDARTSTRRKHDSALGIFVDWTDSEGIDNMNDVSGRQLMRFRTWRKNETQIKSVSLNGNLSILRVFLQFCELVDAVEKDLFEKVPVPNVPTDEEISDVVPSDDEVEGMRDYYAKFEYASRRQTQLELITEVGLRLGAVRAIDIGDFDGSNRVIYLRHRPEGPDVYGTPLKNGTDGERLINLSTGLVETIRDYVDNQRVDVEGEYGRYPLFTTHDGRVTRATIRRDFYKLTRPCMYSGECPHDREMESCEGTMHSKTEKCPSRYSTHPFRKWSIMHQLDAGVPMELLSDRVDVSVPILRKHYDHRSKERKSRRRLEELKNKLPAYSTD